MKIHGFLKMLCCAVCVSLIGTLLTGCGNNAAKINEDIWNTEDKTAFVIDMYTALCEKCNYGDDIEKLSAEERIFFVAQELEMEVNNGGFSKYFYNSSGTFSYEIYDAFMAIGAEATADICKKALGIFEVKLPTDTEERRRYLEENETEAIAEFLSDCDGEFFEYPDDLTELCYNFAFENRESFN